MALLIFWTAVLACAWQGAMAAPLTAEQPQTTKPKTFRLLNSAPVRDAPNGHVLQVWDGGTTFTSNIAAGDWVRVTGYFPDGSWAKNRDDWWIRREHARRLKNRPSRPPSDDGIARYIVIDKRSAELEVFEQRPAGDKVIFQTPVALGMDGCLPKALGGQCYYTDPGTYKVRWKVHDPDGIEWCIPKSMEQEYQDDIAAGRRCFRGPLGDYALNIGKSYAIHGTSHPELLGKKVSHGCVRAANDAMEKLYGMMDVGDPVYIRE